MVRIRDGRLYRNLVVLLAFTLLTVVFTYPLVFEIGSNVAGDGGDSYQNIWNLWWVEESVLAGEDFYYTDYMFYPSGTSLTFHTLSLTNTLLLGLPLMLVLGNLILVYNILFFVSFILSGYGMYLFIKYLVGDGRIAFVVAFAYAFSPYHMAQGLGHLNLLSIQWLPFFFLFFIKTLKERKLTNPVLAGIFLVLLSLSSWQYMMLTFLFILGYTVYVLYSDGIGKKRFLHLVLMMSLFSLVIFPFVGPMIQDFSANDYTKSAGGFSLIEPYNYVLPNPLHPVTGDFFSSYYPLNISDSVVFLGFFVLFSTILYSLDHYRKVSFWIVSSFVFFILSLDPNILHNVLFSVFPFFKSINNMERFALGVLFSVLVIFAYSLNYYIPVIRKKLDIPREYIIVSIFIVLAFEFISIPYYTTSPHTPEALNEVRDGEGKVVNVPHLYNSQALYLQTVHEKKMLGGYVSRMDPGSLEELREVETLVNNGSSEEAYRFLKNLDVKYILYYPWRSKDENLDLQEVRDVIPTEKLYESQGLIVYEIL